MVHWHAAGPQPDGLLLKEGSPAQEHPEDANSVEKELDKQKKNPPRKKEGFEMV